MLPLTERDRAKVLAAVARRGPLYGARRALVIAASLAVVVAVPALSLARVDVWRGGHRLLGEPATAVQGLQGIAVALAALYGLTFLSNIAAGRFFCGWGCPVGFTSRLGESVERSPRGARRVIAHAVGAFTVAVSIAGAMSWWVDPRVVVDGSPAARATALGVFLALCAGGFAHAFAWRFAFCLRVCPVGLYYRFVTSSSPLGVVFTEARNACIDCGACVKVCPVRLDPRRLGEEQPALEAGESPRLGDAECIRCGDCVEACVLAMSARRGATPPLKFGRTSERTSRNAPPPPDSPDPPPRVPLPAPGS